MMDERINWPTLNLLIREELRRNWRLVASVVGGLALINAGLDWIDTSGRANFYAGVATTVAHISVTRQALERSGLDVRRGGFLPFIGMTWLWTLGIGLASILFLLPGLWLNARWFIAAPIFMAEGEGAFASLGASFARTKNNVWPLVMLSLLIVVGAMGPSFVLAMIRGDAPANPVANFAGYLCMFGAFCVSWLAAVALYRSAPTTEELAEVFA